MPWEYKQSTGELSLDGATVAKGYSGFGIGKNNFTIEHKEDVGSIPRGKYTIGSPRNWITTKKHENRALCIAPDSIWSYCPWENKVSDSWGLDKKPWRCIHRVHHHAPHG